jgi:predicted RNase H-like HicB family nuclease
MRYAMVIEQAAGNFSASVPDLPGWLALPESVE